MGLVGETGAFLAQTAGSQVEERADDQPVDEETCVHRSQTRQQTAEDPSHFLVTPR